MRIQHNIAALNSYRNLTNNNSAVSKNLEKLSSGYRINRAGDDAAGLAISEKMRAQITGLETAQKNAQDGISLVQTAEGALTEVHSMLNRMVELADQSANGTYDNKTDRANLQKEIQSLKDEIDRISEGTNFNGINLLDGSLGSTSGASVAVDVKFAGLNSNPGVLALQQAVTTSSTFDFDSTKLTGGDKYTMELTFSDANGNLQSKSIEFTAAGNTAGDNDDVLKSALEDAFGSDFTIDVTGDTATITAKEAGSSNKLEIFKADVKDNTGTSVTDAVGDATTTAGTDAYYRLNTGAAGLAAFDGTGNAEDHIFEINGQKFAFATADGAKKLASDVNYIETAAANPDADEVTAMISMINNKTGIGAVAQGGTNIDLKPGTTTGTNGNGLTLQIGDTAESFNQLTVSIGDMSTSALGLSGVDISTQAGAKAAVDVIRNAINSVSSTRGDLGAIQNRLEHTINNLSVTTENMTAAESRIRDVDMANEMMAYTKNNILVQASQAMLAQANQIPQGVLQLLQ
ncbi:flagellin N-terminal helical domain-containing protein [[Clostridium] hylemonae]|uniref:flagellin N-terminal helical domain-containing protein n=1 Tax=[Clostridium] hylemonae TaxID=89153 RepID=UPI001105CAF3|nr:flagellin [[Clostridium] hylemonae]MCB7522683.1 flagellin [[Clostridium] hylemonae]BDF06422.1 flagellin [[Clostridium] hylemonae]